MVNNIEEFKQLIGDEASCFTEHEQFRLSVESKLGSEISHKLSRPTLEIWHEMLNTIMIQLIRNGMNWKGAEPAHAEGHFIRDYINTTLILRFSNEDPFHLLIGGLAGVLHDVGTNLVPRYQERTRLIRHAEATGIIIDKFYPELSGDQSWRDMLRYAISAHTHYTNDQTVERADGTKGIIRAYTDKTADGLPHLMIFIPRWVDRLENCGPTHFARQYLTLVETHHDFDGKDFHEVGYKNQMRPLLRADAEIKADPLGRTILEHVKMYADSQNNGSPYGKHDRGFYRYMRNVNRQRANRILKSTSGPLIDKYLVQQIAKVWHQDFLTETIERSDVGKAAASELERNFAALESYDQQFWATVMVQVMKEYIEWHDIVKQSFDEIPEEYRLLPGPVLTRPVSIEIKSVLVKYRDVVKYTEPHQNVIELLSK